MTSAAVDRSELHVELGRILALLVGYLDYQRRSGSGGMGEALRGVAIVEGEVERLVQELASTLSRPLAAVAPETAATPPRADRATSALGWAVQAFRLRPHEKDALLLALAVELDLRFARLVAYLNDHIARTRPTVGLVLAITGWGGSALDFCGRPVVREGLLLLEGDGPLAAQALRVAPEMLPRLCSAGEAASAPVAGARLRVASEVTLANLVIDESRRRVLVRWAAAVGGGGGVRRPLLLAGPDGAGRGTVAQAAAAAIGRGLIEVNWTFDRTDTAERLHGAGREARWHDAVLLVRVADGARDIGDFTRLWTALASWDLPLALSIPAALIEVASASAPVEPVLLEIDAPSIGEREALWRRMLPDGGAALGEDGLRELAARFAFRPGALARAARRALADAERGDPTGASAPLDLEELSRTCRAVGTAGMGPVAQRLPLPYTRADLVLPDDLLAELDLAAAWMRNQRRVFDDWGFGRRVILGRGLTALFAGQPGTGKTMTAQILARELGLDLFRVDLSRVMSKYIGETEKNLSRLFDDARGSGAILFFDEADALFGKRTEVKDAHDRYANLEIGYLLQRMEEHTGTTVLATNRMRDLDEAFIRRFHFILDFPMPRPRERRRIWEGMLPAEAAREPDIDLEAIALQYEVSGGEIRNSVLAAAFMAAEEGDRICLRHLKRGLRRELLKTGRVLDVKQRQALEGA